MPEKNKISQNEIEEIEDSIANDSFANEGSNPEMKIHIEDIPQ